MGAGAVISLFSEIKKNKNEKELNKQIDNRPKYTIQDEAYENQNMARSQAYGRDRAIAGQQKAIEQDASNAMGQAQQVSSSTSDLLSTIAAINSNKNTAIRGLANDEAQIQNQKVGQLYNVNNQMIDEKDKAWNYNTNMPYQMKIAALREKIKYNSEMAMKGVDYETSTSSSFMGSMGGMMGGGGK